MEELIGLILLAVYITAIVGLAALVTYAVIRLFPTKRTPDKPAEQETPSGDGTAAGRLFRKAKRGAA